MKYCPSCGTQIIEGVRYCHECGIDLSTIKIPVRQQHPQQYPMHLPAAFKPPPKKAIIAIILAIISALMLFITGAIPWWSVTVENENEGKTDFTLQEIVVETDHGDNKMDLEAIPDSDLNDVADTTYHMLLISTILMVLAIVFLGLLIWFYYADIHGNIKLFKNILQISMIIAMILILVAPIYYMVAWTQEIDRVSNGTFDTFIGSEEEEGDNTSWGPGVGWILAFGCFILILVTFIHAKKGCEELRRIAPQMLPTN
ncbi:MAG: hypothetical protein A7315_08060 [Candidatus Altiarchaeales archaeon WOR_SM1_79]|nr:MAG: hypothetical protein A7315_08060 [Candidatus Altiarchaeales archaeon WOR_SM1_79]